MALVLLTFLPELLHVCTPSHTLRSSSDTRMLKIQQYKCKTHTCSCFGPHIWNSLPQDRRHCSTLSSCKAKLKTSSSHRISILTNISTQFLLQSLCVCVCLCVCVHACVCACVCVCFHITPYVNCFGRIVLYLCIEYCI